MTIVPFCSFATTLLTSRNNLYSLLPKDFVIQGEGLILPSMDINMIFCIVFTTKKPAFFGAGLVFLICFSFFNLWVSCLFPRYQKIEIELC